MFYKQILNMIMFQTERGKRGNITQLKMSPWKQGERVGLFYLVKGGLSCNLG